MPEIMFGLAIVVAILAILVFALVGFINFVQWLVGSKRETLPKPPASQPKLSDDVLASQRLLDHLRFENKINEKRYRQLRQFLAREFPQHVQAIQRRAIDLAPQRQSDLKKDVAAATKPIEMVPVQLIKPIPPADAGDRDQPTVPGKPFVIAEPLKQEAVQAAAAHPVSAQAVPIAPDESVKPDSAKPAPWDIPDPSPPAPRRSFGELMSGFMQEKNMRWGELTSGILIVLSAVGLVVSLQEQLRDTIPYFSSLLFLLITAAIQGAGIYTLKKWKLRNTSRGTLIIGLLLVPLNFVAACVLSDRRELNDPLLWAAISIGIVGFSAMTWWSSKCLLRRGNLPMTLAIIGCGVGALILNRTIESASSSIHYLVFAIPVVASFLVGTCTFDTRQWVRVRWSHRASNRLFLFLGVTVFATVVALSLVMVQADSRILGLISLSPVVSIVCIVSSWLGSIIYRGSSRQISREQVSVVDRETEGKTTQSIRLTGLVLKVLGLILFGLSLVASASNPTVFVINAMVSTIGLIAMFVHQKDEHLIPIAWGVFASGALIGLNVGLGTFGFDQLTTPGELKAALINGKSAIFLLLVGVAVGGANVGLSRWIPNLKDTKRFLNRGWLSGGIIFLVGCVIALIASLINRDNVFDVMVASGLLMLASIGLLAVCFMAYRKQDSNASKLTHYASVLFLVALAHTMLWNPTVNGWIVSMTGTVHVAWVAMFAIQGLFLCGLGSFLSQEIDGRSRRNASDMLIHWGSLSAVILSIGALSLVQNQTGWATLFELIACVGWLLVGQVWSRSELVLKSFSSAPIVFVSALTVSVGIAELVSRASWCPGPEMPQHWLVQLVGLSAWGIVWTCLSAFFGKSKRWRWLKNGTGGVDQVILFLLVFVAGSFVCDSLMPGIAQELSASSTLESNFGLGSVTGWMIAALASVGVAMLISLVSTPTAYKGAAVTGIWFLAWAFGAEPFGESISVASAIRWLLPIGGLVGALMIGRRQPMMPVWAAMRNGLGFSGKSYWKKSATQQLINFALTIASGVVLLVSTVTVSQFLLNGVDSFGGPEPGSWFSRIPVEISYGIPIAIIVTTFLMYAISENRSWLATIGSAVFQYFVVLAIVLLFISPHSSLASERFVMILQSVALGMTVYGFVWFWVRDRIEGQGASAGIAVEDGQAEKSKRWLSQIEVHTVLNGLLITSLAVLAMGRFFLIPDQPGAWISSVGSLIGVIAWAAFGVLAFCVWRGTSTKGYSTATWVWLFGWMGLILVGLVSAVVDRSFGPPEDFIAWLPFRVVMIGAVMVGLVQVGLIGWFESAGKEGDDSLVKYADPVSGSNSNRSLALPVMLTGSVALAFSVRGAWLDPASFWLYVTVIGVLTVVATAIGWMLRDGRLSFVSAATAVLGVSLVFWKDPHRWFTDDQPYWFHLVAIVLSLLALSWSACYIVKRKSDQPPGSYVLLPNIVLLAGAIWILVAAILQIGTDSFIRGSASSLANPLGVGAIIAVVGLAVSSLWNDQARFRVVSCYMLSVGLAITLASVLTPTDQWRFVAVMLAIGLIVAAWGVIWLNRAKLFRVAERMRALELNSLELAMGRQLPIYSLIVGGLVLMAAWFVIFQFELRPHRYIAALIPFALAVGLGTQSNQSSRRWLQVSTLLLLTVGVLFLAWADLSRAQMNEFPMIRLLVRSLIVLAGAMFVYGGLVTRWVRPGDTWLKSLREIAVVTCGLAIICLLLVIASEASQFVPNVGCGLMVGESIMVAILVAGMIVGLILIAIRPENDPFALSLQGRMGYVYAAEFVCLALIAHLYFSLPWLFQLGIKDYWPFIMMALCFGGVGLAHVLEKRKLTVLGQPLFNSAAVLPLIVAVSIFGVGSEANRELVMLTVGMVYLLISFTHRSLLSGAAAIVFGTLALWMLFHRKDFSFIDHIQLWLIPPAISTLIASQIVRKELSANQLSVLRYIGISIIYVSSTMEVFMSGIGDSLWPPVVLALLSVAGIMSGIMFRVKSFLYFGSLFLLMAMITMVAHAHRSFEHVWPWWAFGIGLGIAILVMFGLFEKRKNEMKTIANQLKDWES